LQPTKTVPRRNYSVKTVKFEDYSFQIETGLKNDFSIVPNFTAPSLAIFFENSIQYFNYNPQKTKSIPPIRFQGDIKTFSQQSRKRMLDKMNQVRLTEYGLPFFLSLTWHYDYESTKHSIKKFLDNFLKRLKRQLPPFHFVWKFEYQKRGAPHFHILIFPLSQKTFLTELELKEIVLKNWLALKQCKCKSCQTYSTDVRACLNYDMLLSYVSKELGKIQDHYLENDMGRFWGNSRELKTKPYGICEIDFEKMKLVIIEAIKIIDERILIGTKNNSKYLDNLKYQKSFLEKLLDYDKSLTLYVNLNKLEVLLNQLDLKIFGVPTK